MTTGVTSLESLFSRTAPTQEAQTGTNSYWADDREEVELREIRRKQEEFTKRKAENLWKSVNIGTRFKDASFDNFVGNDPIRNLVKGYCDRFDPEGGNGLVLCGKYGTGKTHLAVATARAIVDKGYSVWFATFAQMLQDLKAGFSSGLVTDEMSKYETVDLLIIDDLGKEKLSEWASEILYSVIDARYRDLKATVITTNMMPNELGKRIDGAIMSRLAEMTEFIRFDGEDRRLEQIKRRR